jgi:hypothetical protein
MWLGGYCYTVHSLFIQYKAAIKWKNYKHHPCLLANHINSSGNEHTAATHHFPQVSQ